MTRMGKTFLDKRWAQKEGEQGRVRERNLGAGVQGSRLPGDWGGIRASRLRLSAVAAGESVSPWLSVAALSHKDVT